MHLGIFSEPFDRGVYFKFLDMLKLEDFKKIEIVNKSNLIGGTNRTYTKNPDTGSTTDYYDNDTCCLHDANGKRCDEFDCNDPW